jgi:hypothetical protein
VDDFEETQTRIGGWVEDIIRLYAARALGGNCINSAQICETGKTGNKEPRYERQRRGER